jgi:hypothetical protein
MYASDLTQRKRAQVIYRNLQLQKELFDSGKSIRILGQKGGNDYSYMMDLDQACIRNECLEFSLGVQVKSGNGPMVFEPSSMIAVNLPPRNNGGTPFENGDIEYLDATLTVVTESLDDGNVQIPMNGIDFYFFGYNAGAADTIVWNSNNAIFFGPVTTIPGINWESIMNFGPTDGYRDTSGDQTTNPPTPGKGFVPVFGKYILLGSYERRLTNFYRSVYTTQDSKFFISKFVAVFDDYFTYQQANTGEIIRPSIPPPQGIFSVRLIRELTGQNRQWIEVSVIKSPPTPGYSINAPAPYPSGTYVARNSSGAPITSQYDGQPVDANGNLIDPTKISPYDICNGTSLLNTCGTTFSRESPPTGTSFIFESDSTGSYWIFKKNAHLPIQ